MKNLPMQSKSKFKQTIVHVNESFGYSGKKTSIRAMSSYELRAIKLLKQLYTVNKIISWSSEEVIIPYISSKDNKTHRYFMDFCVETKDKIILIEVKPFKQTQKPSLRKNSTEKQIRRYHKEMEDYIRNFDKWKATQEYVESYNSKTPSKKMSFVIWTEKELRI
jgi:5-formyltetrahydrofolate cyclo-ligase